jgi:hypothetical protein
MLKTSGVPIKETICQDNLPDASEATQPGKLYEKVTG